MAFPLVSSHYRKVENDSSSINLFFFFRENRSMKLLDTWKWRIMLLKLSWHRAFLLFPEAF